MATNPEYCSTRAIFVTDGGGTVESTITQTCALHSARVAVADFAKKTTDGS